MKQSAHHPLAALAAACSAVSSLILRLLLSGAVLIVGSLFLLHSHRSERRQQQ
ncbi:MAG: hypothetical protein UDG94_10320 [Peptococcaceae bacterium]|nr:hypothetical protein [Peptococcaceae bacterium]